MHKYASLKLWIWFVLEDLSWGGVPVALEAIVIEITGMYEMGNIPEMSLNLDTQEITEKVKETLKAMVEEKVVMEVSDSKNESIRYLPLTY